MESAGYRHRRSPSSDRLLGVFSISPPSSGGGGGELIEAEVFWTSDFSERIPSDGAKSSSVAVAGVFSGRNPSRTAFARPQKSGILAVLPEPDRVSQVLCRKASISPSSSSRTILAIPRPPAANQERDGLRELSQSVPAAKLSLSLQSSAPVNVPALASRRKIDAFDAEIGGGGDDDDEVLPPHEIVARGSGVSPKTTFSVLEGVGRTLKGRDLRQVRNAIWRKTGFLD